MAQRWMIGRFCFCLPLLLAGCAQTWEAVSSQRFREAPLTTLKHLIRPEDPVTVLLADPPRSGDEQAAAWQRLTAERFQQCAPEEQVRLWHMLEHAATRDSSPVVRMAAIQALGRFPDPRVVGVLIAAYLRADGYSEGSLVSSLSTGERVAGTEPSAGRWPTRAAAEALPLSGPRGYPPEWTTAIRCRALEALGHTQTVEAVRFLAAVAGVHPDTPAPGSDEREVRLAAIRALARCRQPEAVEALAKVLKHNADSSDTALVHRTHEGLVRLTGHRLPPDPYRWDEMLQAGVTIAPEPSWWEEAADKVVQAVRWLR